MFWTPPKTAAKVSPRSEHPADLGVLHSWVSPEVQHTSGTLIFSHGSENS
jgi:hypothetical protein